MRSFFELDVWKRAHQLTLAIYRSSQGFPAEERFGLTLQLRRAAAAVGANLAEGYGRFGHAEFHQFCNIARGSLTETRYHLILARDLGYLSDDTWLTLDSDAVTVLNQLNALMRHLRKS